MSNKLLYLVLIILFSLTSCDKENLQDVNGGENNLRKIAVSVASTKTCLGMNGFTPIFKEGDYITIVNASNERENCLVYKSDDGQAYIETKYTTGTLCGIYPPGAAVWKKNGALNTSRVIVSNIQSGIFGDGHICTSVEIPEGAKTAYFYNRVDFFQFDFRDITYNGKIKVSSKSAIATDEDEDECFEIEASIPEDRICYVAFLLQTMTSTYTFEYDGKQRQITIDPQTDTIYPIDMDPSKWEPVSQ